MGSISGLWILDQGQNGRTGRDTDRNSGTTADSTSPQKGHLRNLPENERESEIYSPTEQCQNRDQLDKRKQKLNPSNRFIITHDNEYLSLECYSIKHNQEEPDNGIKRTRNDSTRNHTISREKHQQLERVREHQDNEYERTIQRCLRTITEFDHVRSKIKEAFERIRRHLKSPEQPLKQDKNLNSQDPER